MAAVVTQEEQRRADYLIVINPVVGVIALFARYKQTGYIGQVRT